MKAPYCMLLVVEVGNVVQLDGANSFSSVELRRMKATWSVTALPKLEVMLEAPIWPPA